MYRHVMNPSKHTVMEEPALTMNLKHSRSYPLKFTTIPDLLQISCLLLRFLRSFEEAHHKRFEASVDTVGMSLGTIFDIPALLDHKKDIFAHQNDDDARMAMEDKYLAIAFIQGANHHRYSGLWRDLKNNMVLGQDKYPKTLPAAYDVLLNYKTSGNKQGGGDTNVRVSFIQTEVDSGSGTGAAQPMENWQTHVYEDGQIPVPCRNGLCFPTLKCYQCQHDSHIARFFSSTRNVQVLRSLRLAGIMN